MSSNSFKRRLITILSADVMGYSRLMSQDDVETVNTLKAYKKIIKTLIDNHDGRVIDSPGDNLLSEFSSAVQAVNCAVNIQNKLRNKNIKIPAEQRMVFRIGINIGDIIYDNERIYGDGVNITARIEGLADPGGICISRSVYDQVKSHIDVDYEYLGEHNVKNISEPVRIYRVLIEGKKKKPPNRILKLPEKPSIAVLPFINRVGNQEEEFFSDGLTEDLIISLSKISEIFVIARNSSFFYRNKQVKVQQVGKELGVSHVLEGSVAKSIDQVRISAQLVEAETGHHVWADRYDRKLHDIFSLQDEITLKVLKALQVKLTHGKQASSWSKGTDNIDVYLKWLKGRWLIQQVNKGDNLSARKIADEMIKFSPLYSKGYRLLGVTHMCDAILGWSESPHESLKLAVNLFKKTIETDNSERDAHAFLGYAYTLMGKHDQAIIEGREAVSHCPNSSDTHIFFGMTLSWAGLHDEAIFMLNKAMRLNPFPPSWYYAWLGHALRNADQHKKACLEYKRALISQPDFLPAKIGFVISLNAIGQDNEATEIVTSILKTHPQGTIKRWALSLPFKNREDLNNVLKSLFDVGLVKEFNLPAIKSSEIQF